MGNPKRRLQYARPFWVSSLDENEVGQPLNRLTFSSAPDSADAEFDESWLQKLLHRHPQSLPIIELEPAIDALIPVGMEMPTPAGYVDNVFVTPRGNIVLVECKLWRNPEARRRVIAQIIDYAQSMARWSYKEFESAISRSVDLAGQPLRKQLLDIVVNSVGEHERVDEAAFIDAVQRNLRMGRMLLLVVGDGIREDVENLADYLQRHAGFHFTLGLIEIGIFSLPSGGLIVQPRVLARTLNIQRGIIRLEGMNLTVDPGTQSTDTEGDGRSMSLTDELFFEQLASSSPDTARALKSFLELSKDDGVFLSPATKSASLRWESPNGPVFNLGAVDVDAKLQTYAVSWVPNNIGRLDLGHEYLQQIAKLIGGTVRKTKSPTQWYIVKNGTVLPPALDLLQKPQEWLQLIREHQNQLNTAGDTPE